MNTQTYQPPTNVIEFTESAVQHFKDAVKDADAIGVRLRLDGGGCAGFSYKWELLQSNAEVNLLDYQKAYDGWTFYLDNASKPYLMGSVVDKKVSIAGTVIDISAPLASSSCGCGESVSFKI